MGVDHQGWVAWFCVVGVLDRTLTLYGDGKEVRDILHISDLITLYQRAVDCIDQVKGQAYNVGGGSSNAISLLDLIDRIENRLQRRIDLWFAEWHPGDQRVFIADISKVSRDLGWKPEVGVEEGVDDLLSWVGDSTDLFSPNVA